MTQTIQAFSSNGRLCYAVADHSSQVVEIVDSGIELPWTSKLPSANTEAETWALSLELLLSPSGESFETVNLVD